MTTKEILILIAFLLFLTLAFIDSYFIYLKKEKLRKIFKVLPILVLMIFSIIIEPQHYLHYIALGLGLIGDLFLILKKKPFVIFGIFLFLMEHVLNVTQIYLFSNLEFPYFAYIIITISLILFMIINSYLMRKNLKPLINEVTSIYNYSLLFTLISGIVICILTQNLYYLIFIFAYILFFIGDQLLLIKRHIKSYKNDKILIQSIMYISQFLIFLFFITIE